MGNVMRISGLASGMDTDTMVKQLMDAEKIKLNKYNSNKQIKIWSQDAYNDVNKDIANFIIDTKKELELMKTTSSGSLISGGVSNFSWAKKAISSDSNILNATATADAVAGVHNIRVKQLAKGITAASGTTIKDSTGKDITDANTTLSSLLGIGNEDVYKVKINDTEISFTGKDTLSNVASIINNTKKADGSVLGLKANFDITAKRFFISTNGMGDDAKLKVEDVNTSKKLFTDVLNIKVTDANNAQNPVLIDTTGTKTYVGQKSIIDFDGATDIEYSSNQFMLNGIIIDLKSLSKNELGKDIAYEGTIKVDTDTDSVYNKIKGFVDKYNELIDKLDKKTTEKKYRDYQPLTEEQKKSMDKDTVKLWEDKAKSGLLRNDENITKIISDTRSGLYDSVYSEYDEKNNKKEAIAGYKMLTEIGITTGTYQEKGKLKIDETKLKKAISENVDGVMNLLFKTSDAPDSDSKRGVERSKESGVITRIYDSLTNGMKDIIDKSGTGENAPLYRQVKSTILIDFVTKSGSISLLDKDVFSLEKQISNENTRLSRKENAYYKKFAALEKAMNNMNSQSSWLASQLGGGK